MSAFLKLGLHPPVLLAPGLHPPASLKPGLRSPAFVPHPEFIPRASVCLAKSRDFVLGTFVLVGTPRKSHVNDPRGISSWKRDGGKTHARPCVHGGKAYIPRFVSIIPVHRPGLQSSAVYQGCTLSSADVQAAAVLVHQVSISYDAGLEYEYPYSSSEVVEMRVRDVHKYLVCTMAATSS